MGQRQHPVTLPFRHRKIAAAVAEFHRSLVQMQRRTVIDTRLHTAAGEIFVQAVAVIGLTLFDVVKRNFQFSHDGGLPVW